MQRWEYKRVTFVQHNSVLAGTTYEVGDYYPGSSGRLRKIDCGPDEYLGLLGDEGWELVAVDDGWYHLKRLKAGPAQSTRAEETLPGWELKWNMVQAEIVFEEKEGAKGQGTFIRPRFDNQNARQEWAELQRLAAEGWEVVSAFPVIEGHEVLMGYNGGCGSALETEVNFVLKRQKTR